MRLNLMDDKIVGIMKIMHTQSTHNIYLKSTVEIASAPIKKVRLPGVVNIRTVEDVQYSKTRRKWKQMRTNKTVAQLPTQQITEFKIEQPTLEEKRIKTIVTDGSDELIQRQKAIQRQTRKKNINEEINELKQLENRLLETYQGRIRAQEEQVDNVLQDRRQQIYKQIYDNVKKISGVQHEQEINQQRDQDILDFIEQIRLKNMQPIIKQQLEQAKQQIQELQQIGQSKRNTSRKISQETDAIKESARGEIEGVFIRGSANLGRSNNSSPQQQGYRRMRSSQRTIIIRQQPLAKADSMAIQASPTIQQSPSKVVDQELLHILVTRWKNINVKSKKKLKRNRHIQNIDTDSKLHIKRSILANKLLEWLKRMNRCKISLKMMTSHVFPKKPYSINGSYAFLRQLKFNNHSYIMGLINQDRNLLFEYNHLGQTCLHIAAKYGHDQLIVYLLRMGADYEAKDFANRTPIYYAVAQLHQRSFTILIRQGASPWNINSTDPYFANLLKQIRKIHTIIAISPIALRSQLLQYELDKVL